ncbi:MAG TPA: hypothetical protein VJB08_03165 [Candidatus Nanoarchaeia archaeon]|nr:hypothetical protein [Candidatus Nanoarchaeia archaeon]
MLDPQTVTKIEKRIERNQTLVYGNRIIRNELRETSAQARLGKQSKRILLLNLYDRLTAGHEIIMGDLIRILAKKYYEKYRRFDGKYPYDSLKNDFLIVASASIKELNIVVSHDTKTMLSELAMKAYKKINSENGLENPDFIPYQEYKRRLDLIDPPV